MPAQPDFSTKIGRRTLDRLEAEKAIWLTTVAPDGTPQPNPVWFIWDGETVLVYSHRDAYRNRNLGQNQRIALNFDSSRGEADVNIITGSACFAPDEPPVTECPPYLAKYAEAITGELGTDAEHYAADYSVAIRITPERIRGF
ncbi:MAG TPA: TIGR03667 family PPOX class F420-dependent oxidoreductase [Candidatus Dormibacteraeota bacterium]|nr:TIGR03667 family PPOX class F420-dependent oxidoreductase [Candidatus Dormibacteraeota bacterium]